MIVYSISDIEKLSGVKAHTIRIWEKRYDIVQNRRTDSNIRYYLEEDLQKILNIALLNRKGYKISKIASMCEDDIKQVVATLCDVDQVFEDQLDGLALAMFELNEFKFLKIIDHHIEEKGFEETMNHVIYPFLDKLSIMWVSGSVRGVHETFITNIIRRKISVEIDKCTWSKNSNSRRFMVYLPEKEGHELSSLFLFYILRSRGSNVLYLGANVPISEVLGGIELFKPEVVLTIINDSFEDLPLQPYLDLLSKSAPECTFGITGYQTVYQDIKLPSNMVQFNNLDEIKYFINNNLRAQLV